MGVRAIDASLKDAGAAIDDIGHLCCVTTTGFLTPGLTALLIREMGIPPQCSRVDVVGMGCNAGLNALGVTAAWSAAHPRQLAVLLCAEACSAAYVFDSTMRTAVVNSLFGDGAAAIVLTGDDAGYSPLPATQGPRILSFASHIITDAVGAMGTTGITRRASSASTSIRISPMWSVPMRSWLSTACWLEPACAAAISATGLCIPAARR
jgi:predicted naringenin-chalcone synthase